MIFLLRNNTFYIYLCYRMPQVWTSQEEIEFLKGISNKISIDELSKKHNRTPSAMELRLKKIVHENIKNGKSEEGLAKLLNLDIEKIKQYNYEYKAFIEKKEDHGITNNQTASTLIDKQVMNGGTSSKLTIEPPTKTKTINMYNKKLSSTNTKLEDAGTTKEKFIKKITKLKKENKFMREVVDNRELRKKINQMIKDGSLDKKFKSVLKKITQE